MQPPASLKALSDPIYEVFYGLTEQPFAITTDPRFFYLSNSHQRAYIEILNGLRRRESLLMLTGDTGTGKTTMCRAVIDALGDRTFSAIILNPYMTGAEVLRIVLRDFGLVSHEELRRGGLATADVAQLIDTLEGFLRGLVPLGSHAVLVLDEAQSLAPTVLDQVRMLTGLEYKGHKLLQVVLCGQPTLQQMIQADALLALNERITRRVELRALPPEDIPGYIQHRLGVAGGTNSVRFDAAAMQAVADLSRGLPRRINVLCDRGLQEGRIEGVNVITAELIKRAARAVAGAHDPLPVSTEPKRPAAPVAPTPTPPLAGEMEAAAPAPAPMNTEPAPPPVPARQPQAAPPPAAAARPAPAPTTAPQAPPPPQQPRPQAAPAPVPAPQQPRTAAPAASVGPVPGGASTPAPAARVPVAPPPTAPPVTEPPLPRPGPVQVQPASATARSAAPAAAARPQAASAPPNPAAPPTAGGAVRTPAAATPTEETRAWPRLEAPVEDAPEPGRAVPSRELSFTLEEPGDTHRGRKLAIAAAVLAVVSTVGYASWSWDVRDAGSLVGTAPAGPALDLGMDELPGVPAPDVIDQVFQPGFIGLPRPAAAPNLPQAAPEAPRPAAGSDPFSAPVAEPPTEPAPTPAPDF